MESPKRSIFYKILIIPLVGAISLIVSLAINTSVTQKNSLLLEDAELVQFPLLQIAEKNLVQLERIKEALSGAVTTGDADSLEVANKLAATLEMDLAEAKLFAKSESNKIGEIENDFGGYYSAAYTMSSQMIDNTADFSKLEETARKMNAQYEQTRTSLTAFRDLRLSNFTNAISLSKSNASDAILYGIVIGVVAIIALFGTAIPICRGILASVKSVVTSLKDIAQEDGDLTVRLEQTSQDEIGELVHWFNTFVDKLQGVISQIVVSVNPLSDISETLEDFVTQTLGAVEEQRKQTHEVENSASEINQNVGDISTNAKAASTTAEETEKFAQDGLKSLMDTVDKIGDLSQDISETAVSIGELEQTASNVALVIGVIRSIAEQTNLLALNAAIEAARAGEQGRGFAVVADEVRSLANKTQESTDEIQGTIDALEMGSKKAVQMMESSTTKTSECVASVKEAGDRFESIMENITKTSATNATIAAATDTQHDLTSQLQVNATNIRSGADQSHTTTSKLAENIQELSELTHSLKSVAAQFKI